MPTKLARRSTGGGGRLGRVPDEEAADFEEEEATAAGSCEGDDETDQMTCHHHLTATGDNQQAAAAAVAGPAADTEAGAAACSSGDDGDAEAGATAGGSHKHHHHRSSHHHGSTSLAAWLVKRIQNMKLFQPKRDVDLEELELQPARYRPDRLEVISKTTRFSKKEIQFVYRAFKQECPTGMISEETFKSIYAKFFPLGDSSQYAHYVFSTLDREKTGTISFGDFMLGLSVLVKGSLQERLRWAFSLYDVNNDGCITREEMTDVISAIYDLMGASHTDAGVMATEASKDHVDRIFKKLDLNNDGVITVDEFIDYCSMNEDIRSSFAVFDDLW